MKNLKVSALPAAFYKVL